MAALATLSQRLQWTRGWLEDFRQTQTLVEDDRDARAEHDHT